MAWTEKYVTADSDGGDGSEGNPWTLAEAITNVAAGNRVNVKAGTYANTTTGRTFSTAGTATAPIWWRGYKTTIGDLDAAPTTNRTVATDIPHITFTTASATFSGAHQWLSALSFLSTAANAGTVYMSGGTGKVHRCRAENQNAGASSYAFRSATGANVFSCCYAKATSSASVIASASRDLITGCVIEGGSTGINDVGLGCQVLFNLFDSQGSDAIIASTVNNDFFIAGNTIYNPGGHGINIAATRTVAGYILNNLFNEIRVAAKVGIYYAGGASSIDLIFRAGNSFYNVTTPESGFGDEPDFDRVAESSEPLNDPANQDFRMLTAALSKGAGLPGLFEGLTIKSFFDIGAVQRAENTFPAAANVWTGTGTYGDVIAPTTPTKRASSIANCSAANIRYDVTVDDVTGAIEMPNTDSPTGTQDATSDACVVSGKKYGSPQRTGTASGGGGGGHIIGA